MHQARLKRNNFNGKYLWEALPLILMQACLMCFWAKSASVPEEKFPVMELKLIIRCIWNMNMFAFHLMDLEINWGVKTTIAQPGTTKRNGRVSAGILHFRPNLHSPFSLLFMMKRPSSIRINVILPASILGGSSQVSSASGG